MDKNLVLQLLDITEIRDENDIRTAYRQKLKNTNPEDDPEGFRRLREAYEQALNFLHTQEEEEQTEKSDIDLWIDRADAVYQNFRTRADVDAWKEILEDPICQNLDTSLEARDAMLKYLMYHFFLPQEIWQCLDKEFQISEDIEELKEYYPEDFLEYIIFYLENSYFIDFNQMQLREGASMENINVDGYIKAYQDLRRSCDQNEWKKAEQQAKEIAAYGVYYPWESVEQLRIREALYFIAKDAPEMTEEQDKIFKDGIMKYAKELAESYPESPYVLAKAGGVIWRMGDHETAFSYWEKSSANNEAKLGMVHYYLEDERDPEKAKGLAIDLMDDDFNTQVLEDLLKKANEILIKKYTEKIEQSQDKEEKQSAELEIAWCCYQNREAEKAYDILDKMEPSEKLFYSYHNLKGRVLTSLGRYQEAIPELQTWLSMILETVDDGSEESKKRLRRKGSAYHMLGWCKFQLKEHDEAIELLKRAKEELQDIQDISELLSCMNGLAEVYLDMEAYEKAVDECDQIISRERGFYPAYINRQTAYFYLKDAQEVVDNYHQAIEIYPKYYKPYLLAAKVLFFCHQYENAKDVLEHAKQNEVEFSDEMKLYQIKILRNLAENDEDRMVPMELCHELINSIDKNQTDIEDDSEPEYELALLWWDNNKNETALEYLKKAIYKNPSRNQYFMVQGEIQMGLRRYKDAMSSYKRAKASYDDTASYYYGIGCCYEGMGNEIAALENFLKAADIDVKYRDLDEKISDIYMERYNKHAHPEDFEAALRYVNMEVEKWESCYTLVHRGLMYMDAMRLSDALADFEKALTFRPDDWAAYNNMGYCYKNLKEFDKGIEMYQKSLECLKKTNEKRLLPWSNMADCYELKRDYQSAIDCYLKDLKWYPERKSFFLEIGDLYRYLGEYEKSIEYYKKEGLDDNEYLLRIGDVYFAQGKLRQAENTYRRAATKCDNRYRYERHIDYAERLLDYLLNYKGALKILQKAEDMHSRGAWGASWQERARNMKYQARAYFLCMNMKKASECAELAIEYYLKGFRSEEEYLNYLAERPLRLSNIGQCYLYMGETEKAFAYFDQMETGLRCKFCREPQCYEAYRNRGLFYVQKNNKVEALKYYRAALEITPTDLELQAMINKINKEI